MRIKRKLIAAMMTGLAVMLSAALLGGTLTVATSAAKSASTAKAKHKKPTKKPKTTCPKGTTAKKTKKGTVCIKTNTKTEVHKVIVVETITKPVTVTSVITTEVPGAEEAAEQKLLSEEAALVHPGLWPTESKEAGGTKAVENASEIPKAPKWTNEQLDAWPSGNWFVAGGGNSLDRYSDLSEINLSTVSGLKSDWMLQVDGSSAGNEAPVDEYDGVLYWESGYSDVFAISVKTGKILWIHLSELVGSSFTVCCGDDSRGVALWDGMVYAGTLNAAVEALEMTTGKLVWYSEVGYRTEGFGVNAAPLLYNGMVFIGATGAENNVRGFMEALNAETGAILWKKFNIPGPGEYGHETWPTNTSCQVCNYSWASGGAAVWNAPAVDPETGDIIYVASNAGGQFAGDYTGQDRNGANLWTDSFIARHPLTGNIAWGFQTTHHDIWDYDMSSSVAMLETEVAGKKITDVAQSSKNGYGYDLEATTGAPQTGGKDLGIEEKPVPTSSYQQSFPTQPIPHENWAVERLQPSGVPCPVTTPVKECPTPIGSAAGDGTGAIVETEHQVPAANTHPGEYEEAQAAVGTSELHAGRGGYPCSTTNTCPTGENVFQLWNEKGEPVTVPGQGGNSGDRQGAPGYNPKNHLYYTCAAEELESKAGSGAGSFTSTSSRMFGFINAYNTETGETAWSHELPHECYAGFLTTAGELTFIVNATGQFTAYNASTGAVAWEFGKEENAGVGCEHGAEKREGYNPRKLTEKVPVALNKNNELRWCHKENSGTEKASSKYGVSWLNINTENFEYGNPGLGAGGGAPATAFEFEGHEYIVVVADGAGLSSESKGDSHGGPYMWEFSLNGSGAEKPVRMGEDLELPKEELCKNWEELRKAGSSCGEI